MDERALSREGTRRETLGARSAALTALAQATAKGPGTMPLIGAARNGPTPEAAVGEKQISEAAETLRKYKAG